MGNSMRFEDMMAEIYRMIEVGDVTKESRLESISLDFQDDLSSFNRNMGKRAYNEFIGPPQYPPGDIEDETFGGEWAPFTEKELDAIRHYYGQKIALESEGSIVGLAAPLSHEVFGQYGLFSPISDHYREDSLYDLYVNAIAAKDYYLDEGLRGMPFYEMLARDNMTDEEFIHWGENALEKIAYYEDDVRDSR